ncbi:NADH-quinone oxidoreductase subunit D [bacterium]|nr:NADH-quinone oxidoreductase subunit D [bacterium]
MKAPQHPESIESCYHLVAPTSRRQQAAAGHKVPLTPALSPREREQAAAVQLAPEHGCRGTACFAARHRHPARWAKAERDKPRVYCMGRCYVAPATAGETARPHVEVRSPQAILLANLVDGGARQLDIYLARGGYRGLERALLRSRQEVVGEVLDSQLRGRGGAGFPSGVKMRAVAANPSPVKYVVANGDEGDPGSFTDRFLMEDDPFRLIEAMSIAGYAVGAAQGYIYLRCEYPEARAILLEALSQARSRGFLGERVLSRDFSFDIQLVSGHGSYVCGEETALLRSIEGRRPEVMPRPPFPTDKGLFGKPTLLLNIETLCNLPWILEHGGEAYCALGYNKSRGTKALSLPSLFRKPGIYEVEFGTTLATIVEEIGGGMADGRLVGVMPAGPMGGIVPASLLATPLDFEALRAVGGNLGHGGIVAIDEHTSIPQLVHHIFEFAADESCGKCTPCRVGSRRLADALARALADCSLSPGERVGVRGSPSSTDGGTHPVDRGQWKSIVEALAQTSLCGLGVGLSELANSVNRYFQKEFSPCLS